ncbi:hypothetical protein [Paenibacillus sp. NFR01]|uniref:hypothetical protein n=1 Tax=Paenibacillus sp. NFR01 TaxID=1566279 RepID=UPI0008B82C0A|nr:hypothetical protein [Paenibacillus sp. NFR01]SET52828.1 hypothetical protein SAMN03159358_1939 [Paenibacillus sp. NFR01]
MKRGGLIGATLFLAVASASILPALAGLAPAALMPPGEVQALGAEGAILRDDNLVDRLADVPFTLPIDSAGWKAGVLTLDLKVTGNDHEPEELYRNMAEAIGFAFQDTANVEQLLLRVLVDDKWLDSRRLLLAGDIRRSEWSSEGLGRLREAGNRPLPEALRRQFRISESELWRKQFIYP